MTQPVTDVRHRDSSKLLSPDREKRQSLRGFDDDYVDIVDYIVRCTHKIWEEKGMGLIYTHYKHDAVVYSGMGVSHGREEVLASSIQTLAAFPDRRLFAEDVIWTGNDEEGFHTSHRILSVAHNTGYSAFGPPTGRRVVYRVLANCFVKENMICEEWLLRDDLSVVRQLGLDENAVVAQLAAQDRARGRTEEPVGEIDRVLGQTTPRVLPPPSSEGFSIEDFVRRTMHEVWNWRFFNRINECYAEDFRWHGSASRELYGRAEYLNWVIALIAMFPDAKFTIDHLYWLSDDTQGYRTAMRWTLVGTHKGYGIYGAPTNKRVRLWGITQHRIENEKFVEEWTLFNELDLLKQLYLARHKEQE